LGRFASAAYRVAELKKAQDARRASLNLMEDAVQSKTSLTKELIATRELQSVSALLIEGGEIEAVYKRIVDAAVVIMGSDFASLQMLYPERAGGQGELLLLAHHGFAPESAEGFKWVRTDTGCTCGETLLTGTRTIAADVESAPFIVGRPGLQGYRQSGIRAVQTTPLTSRGDGRLIGMISTHWRSPHMPSESDLRQFDILARQAADLIEHNLAEEALRQSKQHLELLSNTVPALIFYMGPDRCYRSCNDTFTTWFGLRREEVIGLHVRELVGEETWELIRPRLDRAFAGETIVYETEAPFRLGGSRWIHAVYTPARDPEGTVLGVVGFVTDITPNKLSEQALRASEERVRTAMTAGEMGAWDIDLATGTVTWDAKQRELFGQPIDKAPKTLDEFYLLLHTEDVDRIKRAAEMTERTGKFSEEFRIIRTDGQVRWIVGQGATVYDGAGRPIRMIGVNYDITDRKAAQARLERFTEELEQKVTERTSELLESENRLRVLATELNLAEHRERKRLATDLHDYLALLLVLCRMSLGQAKRIGLPACVEDLIKQTDVTLAEALTYCRTLMAELSPPVLQEEGLPAGLRWLAEHMKNQDLAVTLEVDEVGELPIPDDRAVLLFQSVRELLINVAKHGAVKTATLRMTHEDGLLALVVRDENGFDLAATAAEKISPMSSKFGLFSIRERMKALGGTFDIRSAPGQGTTVTLSLPLPERKEREKRAPRTFAPVVPVADVSPVSKASKIRVLLVDDHTVLRQGLRSIVSAYSHFEVVGEAGDGMEAVELVQRLNPDVVVMDINMPNLDGIEATRLIKAYRPDITVIGLSVNQSMVADHKLKAAGASSYLTKESAVETLCRAIDEAISQKQGTAAQQAS
jgi:PAS domain S-box-containing protein